MEHTLLYGNSGKLGKTGMIKVTHVITGLETGGAEMMLYKLLQGLDTTLFCSNVVSLTGSGAVGEKIENLGIPLRVLEMHSRLPNPLAVWRLARWLRQEPPDLVQTWMYHADLVGGLAAKMAGRLPVVWNVRASELAPEAFSRRTIWIQKLCARLSGYLPTHIIFNSLVARRIHVALGYRDEKSLVIPNGFDLTVLSPDPRARREFRHELKLADEQVLVGKIARFDVVKDHHNFFAAAALISRQMPHVRFVLCGDRITWENNILTRWIDEQRLRRVVYLLGRRDDIPRIMTGLDVAVLASSGEGFPNVVGEAMACGVPCVVTDVGDAPMIVGATGRVVPSKNPQALAEACIELLEMSPAKRQELGLAARQRIEENYSLPAVVASYQTLYQTLVSK
jgi:glycosyltransferase involved in cell wall biosynthesis